MGGTVAKEIAGVGYAFQSDVNTLRVIRCRIGSSCEGAADHEPDGEKRREAEDPNPPPDHCFSFHVYSPVPALIL